MFVKWPEIESLQHVVRSVRRMEEYGVQPPKTAYRPKVKLHGSNAGVRVENGEVIPQQRTMDCDEANSNFGFVSWVEKNKEFFQQAAFPEGQTVFFGEWCGSGIMSGTSLQKIGKKIFSIFAISHTQDGKELLMTEPEYIRQMFKGPLPADVYILPWHTTGAITLDFSKNLENEAEEIGRLVLEVEASDPWVKENFGVEGIGEGVVYYPQFSERLVSRSSMMMFKAKGDRHKVATQKKVVQVDIEKANSVQEFVKMFVTEQRCEQGLAALGGAVDLKLTGDFIAWMGKDILKESHAELEVSGLKWPEVAGAVNNAARKWFTTRAKKVG